MYKLALNDPQRLICHKTKTPPPPPPITIDKSVEKSD